MSEHWNGEQFRDDVLAFIERQGITKSRLAVQAGLYPVSVSRFLANPRSTIPIGTVAALAHATDLSLDRYIQES